MLLSPEDCCVLNTGNGAWAFESLATRLSSCLGVDISEEPRRFNYLLHLEEEHSVDFDVFIPIEAIRLASDKRLLAGLFLERKVQIPQTFLCDTFAEARSIVRRSPGREWCLKYPVSCGANGHRLLTLTDNEPSNWPLPFVVQEFIRLDRPEVYRTYCAGGELFGWVVRRYQGDGASASPWVAHAQGARYATLEGPPPEALMVARSALEASQLWNSFGCVDLIRGPSGEWLTLEVGTDGLFNHVDRDLGDASLEHELDQMVARSFWQMAAHKAR